MGALLGVGVVAVPDALVVLFDAILRSALWLACEIARMGSAVDKAACQWGMGCSWDARTWYLVRRVLHTPVSNIIPTRKGITALEAIFGTVALELYRRYEV